MDIKCIYCDSENVYYSKKKQKYICEDCEKSFLPDEKEFVPKKVFLSYGHDSNEDIVNLIYDKLVQRGHKPWIDHSKIKEGDDWRNTITEGVLESDCFIAFLSKHSVREPGVCLDEISIGVSNYRCTMCSVLLENDVTPPNSISGIQWLDLSDWKSVKDNSEPETWAKWINEKCDIIYKILEDEERMRIAGSISTINDKLEPITNPIKMRFLLQKEIIPREWLLKEIQKHINKKAIVIYGSPGTGKSVLSAYLCNFSTECCTAYFCEWNNSLTRDIRKMLFSIIFQLCCSLNDYRNNVVKLLEKNSIEDFSNDEILDVFLFKPLNNLIDGGREQKIIVIDALDEALKDNTEMQVIIVRLIESLPSWITVLITSRPEEYIVDLFQQYDSIVIDEHRADMNNDIYKYVHKVIKDKELAEKIIEKSDGSFLYAREAIKLVNETNLTLDSIPPGISGAYYSNFHRLFPDDNEYLKTFRPFFEVILAAKEQISIEEVCAVLNIDKTDLKRILRRVRSYVFEMMKDDTVVLHVFHKSFLDWLISDNAGIYLVSIDKGNQFFSDYLINCVNSNKEISRYAVNYGYEHFTTKKWDELSADVQEKLLDRLIDSAGQYGNLTKEHEYLTRFEICIGKNLNYHFNALNYYKKTSGSKLRKTIVSALAYAKNHSITEQESFELISQISLSYFYSGLSKKAYDIILEERDKHNAVFWANASNDASYWHSLSLAAHDLDNNKAVELASKNCVEIYKRERKHYKLFVSMVNLFDGYMALGKLSKAEKVAKQVLNLSEERYFLHADDIIKICYANLLLTQNRIVESLAYYEEGLILAKQAHSWDYLYGSVWRELAVARFYDKSAIDSLKKYREEAKKSDFSYIVSLADCFIILAAHIFKDYTVLNDMSYYKEIEELELPGHILQAAAVLMLDEITPFNPEIIIDCINNCEGVKGEPTVIKDLAKKYSSKMNAEQNKTISKWCEEYVTPIEEYRNNYIKELVKGLDDSVKLCSHNCVECGAKCCYDGVYITPAEEKRITDFVEKHADKFKSVNKPMFVDGKWPGMRSKRKTEKVPYNGYDNTFPKHFTKTRCTFALESGECLLQKVATEMQLHPWKYKPRACWLFPINTDDGKLNPPTTDIDKDPHYIDESYPGYVSFLPCVKRDCNGNEWYNKYLNEIEYYYFISKND